MALNFFEEGGLLNFYKAGGEIAIRKTNFNSHKNHNPDCDILEGYIDDDSFITYCVYVKDATNGSKKGDEYMEYYSGENYVPGSKKRSNSKHFTVSEIPAKYLAAWNKLKEDYKANYAEVEVNAESLSKLADGGKIEGKEYIVTVRRTSWANKDIEVDAKNESEAAEIALEEAGNLEFGSGQSDYEVDSVIRKDGESLYATGGNIANQQSTLNTILDYYSLSKYDKDTVRAIRGVNNSYLNLEGLQIKLRALVKRDGMISKYMYDMFEKDIERLGGKMPEGIIVSSQLADGGAVDIEEGIAEAKDLAILDAWGKYATKHDLDIDDIDDFNAYLNKEHSNIGSKGKQKAIREFQLLHPELDDDFADGGAVKTDTLVDTINILNAWEKYAMKKNKDEDDIEDFNEWLNGDNYHGSTSELSAQDKKKAIREFQVTHPDLEEEFAVGGKVNEIWLLVNEVQPPITFEEFHKANTVENVEMSDETLNEIRNLKIGEEFIDGVGGRVKRVHKPKFAGGGAVEADTLVEVIGVLNAWELYAKKHDKDVDDIDDFNAYLNREHASLGSKKKQAAIKEFAQIHKEEEEFATGGKVGKAFAKKKDAVIAYAIDNMDNLEEWGVPAELLKNRREHRWKICTILEDKFDDDYIISKYDDITKSEYAAGGEVKPIAPTEHYRYLDITKYPNGLELAINDEGREEVRNLQEDEKGDYEIMGELFDYVQGNSEYIWHENLGDQGFGLTSAPGITDGYYYDDDNGMLTDKGQEDSAELYSFMGYELHSPLELMLRDGKVFFARVPKEGDELDAKGVPVKKYRKGKKHEAGGGIDDYFSDPDNAAAYHSYVDAHKDDEKEVKGLVLKNITKNKYVETEKNGKVILTKKLEDAMRFWKDGDESESDAEATLALLNEQHKDSYSLIETDDVQ